MTTVVFGYRRLRLQLAAVAAVMAALAVLIGWLGLAHQKSLWDLWFFLGLFGFGALAAGVWSLYIGAAVVTASETSLSEKRPFRSLVSIAWSEVAEVTRFELEKETDVVAAGGKPAVTIHDQIDRFAELQPLLLERAQGRYLQLRRRRSSLPAWSVPAAIIAAVVGLAGWNWLDHGRVRVTVVDATGAPVPAAKVFFYNKRHPQPQDKADAAGFVERRLPSAPYYLSVSSGGFESYSRRVDVRMLATEELRVTLQPAMF